MSELNTKARKIVDYMLKNDPFSQWLNIELIDIKPGDVSLKCTIRQEMLNGFSILHGGIYYSLADSALAFAANGYGQQSKSIETSISHLKPCAQNDVLTASVKEIQRGFKTALYQVEIYNQNQELVALFKGTVYISSKTWDTILS